MVHEPPFLIYNKTFNEVQSEVNVGCITLLFSNLAGYGLAGPKFRLELDPLEFEHVSGPKVAIPTETEPKVNRIDVAASQVAS